VREVAGEVISLGGILVVVIVLQEFLSDLFLKPWKGSGEAKGVLNHVVIDANGFID
jgi:hypothetical protein